MKVVGRAWICGEGTGGEATGGEGGSAVPPELALIVSDVITIPGGRCTDSIEYVFRVDQSFAASGSQIVASPGR